jgi:DNA-binding Xre family transcriptional regulator
MCKSESLHYFYTMKLRIKEIAKQKGVSLVDLAAKMGVTNTGLHQALRRDNMGLATLEKFAKHLECDIIELIEPTDPELIHIYDRSTDEYMGIARISLNNVSKT